MRPAALARRTSLQRTLESSTRSVWKLAILRFREPRTANRADRHGDPPLPHRAGANNYRARADGGSSQLPRSLTNETARRTRNRVFIEALSSESKPFFNIARSGTLCLYRAGHGG